MTATHTARACQKCGRRMTQGPHPLTRSLASVACQAAGASGGLGRSIWELVWGFGCMTLGVVGIMGPERDAWRRTDVGSRPLASVSCKKCCCMGLT